MSFPGAASPSGWQALLDDDAALADGVAAICRRHGLDPAVPARYRSGSLPVYAPGSDHVLKLFPPHEETYFAIESRVLAALSGALPIPTPRPLYSGSAGGWHYIVMSQLHGRTLVEAWPELAARDRERFAGELGSCVAALHAIGIAALVDIPPRWDDFMRSQHESAVQRQRSRGLAGHWVEQISDFLRTWMPPIDAARSLLHTELMREHLLVARDGASWRLSGLFDFEPAMVGAPEYDFASFGLFVSCGDGPFLRRALLAYGYPEAALGRGLQCRFMAYAILHRYSNLRWYLERLPSCGETTLEQLAARWWSLEPSDG